jgi:hypothetical protein
MLVVEGVMMTIPELEQHLLSLDQTERQRLCQLLAQSLVTESIPSDPKAGKLTLAQAIAHFRNHMSAEELDPNAEDIWQDVRDRTPISHEPRW